MPLPFLMEWVKDPERKPLFVDLDGILELELYADNRNRKIVHKEVKLVFDGEKWVIENQRDFQYSVTPVTKERMEKWKTECPVKGYLALKLNKPLPPPPPPLTYDDDD